LWRGDWETIRRDDGETRWLGWLGDGMTGRQED
jgi:hypothetical protein